MSKITGEEHRELKRQEHIDKVISKAIALFQQAFPEPTAIITEAHFLKGWEAFEGSLLATFGQQKDFRQAFKRGEHLLNQYKKHYHWSYSPPTTVVTNRLAKQTRDTHWLRYSWDIYDQYDAWRQNYLNTEISNPSLRYQSIMLSLIFESGQMDVNVIKAFHDIIIEGNALPLRRFSCYTYISLILNNEKMNTNTEIDGQRVTEYQCYLSLHTLAQLRLWIQTDKIQWSAPDSIGIIYKEIVNGFITPTALPSQFKKFCHAAVTWYERHHHISASQALLECRTGRTHTYSLPANNIEQIVHPRIMMPKVTSFYHFHLQVTISHQSDNKKDAKTTLKTALTDFYSTIQQPFLSNSSHKLSQSSLTKALSEIMELYQLEEWQSCFVEWLKYKLYSCKPSTVNSYRNTLIKDWIIINTENNLDHSLTSETLESIYQQRIDRHKSEKSKKNFSARLKDLHSFAYSYLRLPLLGDELFHADPTQNHTKAGIIDESLFKALLQHINTLNDINSIDKLALQSLSILSYRCGLRMAELYKLQMQNISQCDQVWISIRSNEFGDNKTASSLRKIPVLPLLLDDEKSIIDRYLQHKRSSVKSSSAPLFTMGEDHTIPFNTAVVSNYVGRFFKVTSGLEHLVFYHLRHSCLSRLQLMLELPSPYETLPNFYPYQKEQHEQIRQLIFKKSVIKGYWEIAAFAGHKDPGMTFNHYLHLSDMLAAPKKEDYLKPVEFQDAMAQGIFSQNRYWAMNKKHNQKVILAYAFEPLLNKLNVKEIIEHKNESFNPSPSLSQEAMERFSIDLCYQILESLSQGCSVDSLAFKYRIKTVTIENWLSNAHYLKALKAGTQKSHYHQSRIFSDARKHALVPGKLKTKKEKEYARIFNVKLREHYSQHKDQFNAQMNYFLTHCSVSQSGIVFNHPDDLTRFLDAFSFVIPKAHWRVMTQYMQSSTKQNDWKAAYQGLKVIKERNGKKTGRTGNGSVRLELISPDEKTMTKGNHMSKYSSHLLKYLLFFTFVMIRH